MSAPSPQSGAAGRGAPTPLIVTAGLAVVEALVLLLLAVLEVASTSAERLTLGATTTLFFAACGAGLLACAVGVRRGRTWARGPLLLSQLVAVLLAWSLRDVPLVAVTLLVSGGVALAGLLHPDSIAYLEADRD